MRFALKPQTWIAALGKGEKFPQHLNCGTVDGGVGHKRPIAVFAANAMAAPPANQAFQIGAANVA